MAGVPFHRNCSTSASASLRSEGSLSASVARPSIAAAAQRSAQFALKQSERRKRPAPSSQ